MRGGKWGGLGAEKQNTPLVARCRDLAPTASSSIPGGPWWRVTGCGRAAGRPGRRPALKPLVPLRLWAGRRRQREKSQLQWDSAKAEPVWYRTHGQVTREQRAFNPVLQTYTDPRTVGCSPPPRRCARGRPTGPLTVGHGQEAQASADHRERALRTMNRARDRELRFAQRYDVVNHAPRVEDPSAARKTATKPRVPDTRTAYDVVNHIDNSQKPWHDPRACVAAAAGPFPWWRRPRARPPQRPVSGQAPAPGQARPRPQGRPGL